MRTTACITLASALVLALATKGSSTTDVLAGTEPVAKGYRVIKPSNAIVINGQQVEFYSFWGKDSTDLEVWADVSLLDATVAEPLAGSYLGDSSVVEGDSLHLWPCYRFAWTISESNDREDNAVISVPITAFNPATGESTTDEALTFCLLNHPPSHRQTNVIGDSLRFSNRDGKLLYRVRDGDSLHIETAWDFTTAPLMLAADFSFIDKNFDPSNVFYWGPNDAASDSVVFSIWYELSEDAYGDSKYPLPIKIFGYDGACGWDSVTIEIEVDNTGPAGAPVFHDLRDTTVTEAELYISGRAPDESHDILVTLNGDTDFVFDAFPLGDSLVFEGTITLQEGTNRIVACGRDVVGNRSDLSEEIQLDLQNVPVFKRTIVITPDSLSSDEGGLVSVANGQRIQFFSYWDSRVQYNVYADFSLLDTEGPSQRLGTPCEDLVVQEGGTSETWYGYQFEYTISELNQTADDDEIPVLLTAQDPTTGYETTSTALAFCLSNHPPRHLWTQMEGDSARYINRNGNWLFRVRNSGTFTVYTSWFCDTSLYIDMDLSNVDYTFMPGSSHLNKWKIDSLSTDSTRTYGMTYRFGLDACCVEGKDPYPLPVYIFVKKDHSCGWDTTVVLLEMDNEGPAGAPTFDQEPVDQTISGEVVVSGLAPEGSIKLLLDIEHVDVDSVTIATLPVDTTLVFSGTIPVLPGKNLFVAYGVDVVGNQSAASVEYEVQCISQQIITIPKPFRPGDEFVFENPAGWSSLRLELYNLEGDRIRSWSCGSGEQAAFWSKRITWDGRNSRGETVHQGPYLVRLHSTDTSRRSREEVRAFVFKK
ncbi:MAG: hypothetical protein KAY24_12505 [Candidatus Eisenbacteria sp.]|nr:hypothetical protein [Candidatus Eisenbacteria bacterium]